MLGPTQLRLATEGKSRRTFPLPGVGMLKFWVSRICINPDANPDLYLLKSPGTTTRAEDPADGYTHF